MMLPLLRLKLVVYREFNINFSLSVSLRVNCFWFYIILGIVIGQILETQQLLVNFSIFPKILLQKQQLLYFDFEELKQRII